MTTREIAIAVNKTERSVRNWVKRMAEKSSVMAEKSSESSSTHPADYDIEETIAIIETGMGKNAADLYRMSTKESNKTAEDRLDRLESMMEKMLVAIGNMMLMQQAQEKPQERVMLQAPQLDPRAHIIKLVNEYVEKTGIEHRDVYTLLYRDYGYRTHCNAILVAKNRGMKIIDFIESEGQIEILEAVACEVLK